MPKKKTYHTPVGDWLKRVDFKKNRLWRLTPDGVMKTKVGNKWYTAREFDREFPSKAPLYFYGNPHNPDKTKSFLYDK